MRLLSSRVALLASAASFASTVVLGCSQQPVSVPVRSLEQSGEVAFLCLSADKVNPGAWIDTCANYYPQPSGQEWNHLLALVTQPIRGEIALVDLSAGSVVDMDPSKPGYNFVPTGANPVDVVATPGGTAAFVSSAAAGREGIWAIPSRTIVNGPVALNSFAACALPSAPGEMMVLVQPSSDPPPDCKVDPEVRGHKRGDLACETQPPGPRKLLVTLPDEGMLAVVDAQALLDREPGSFEACPVEEKYPLQLQVQLPPSWPQQIWPSDLIPGRNECSLTQPVEVSTSSGYVPRPSMLALDEETSTLYITDETAPVIHVLDVADPLNIVERAPLLPRSVERPEREIITRGIAVSPTTTDGKKFVYAVDLREGSVMVFDVSVGATERTPLIRKNAQRYPFSSPDRLSLAVPVRSIAFALRDTPIADPVTGVAQLGVQCNPEVDAAVGAGYRTTADFTDGAGPRNLRGIFGFLALTNGQIVVVDVDDFDAPCRRPKEKGACCPVDKPECEAEKPFLSYQGADGELSCDVVTRHEMRSATFFDATEASGARVPALQSYPSLSLDNSVLPTDQTDEGKKTPKMLAPSKADALVLIGGRPVESVPTDPGSSEQNIVLFDYREPRVHYEQTWGVVFEGGLPGFAGHVGRIEPIPETGGRAVFWDPGAFFCDRGVHDLDAARVIATDRDIQPTEEHPNAFEEWIPAHVDVLEITSDFLQKDDPYWPSVVGQCSLFECRQTFGLVELPKSARDFPIIEAYQDRMVVDGVTDFVRCCFPFLPSYTVRAKGQWVVTGTASGFLHNVVPDPASGRCIDTCDPVRRLYSGRAYELNPSDSSRPAFEPEPQKSTLAFRNPLMQFVIWKGTEASKRNMTFGFTTMNGFYPLLVNLASSSSYVQPQSMTMVPQLGQLAIADGAAQGLILVDLGALGVSATYF